MITDVMNSGYSGYIRPDTLGASSKVSVSKNGIYYIKVPKYSHHIAPYHLVTAFIPDQMNKKPIVQADGYRRRLTLCCAGTGTEKY